MIGAFMSWWYGAGWRLQQRVVKKRWLGWVDYFSFAILFRTLFAPFRQIGAGYAGGSLDAQFRQWADRTFSRVVGFVVRVCTLVAGTLAMAVVVLVSLVQLCFWLVLPAFPLIGIVLSIVGWMPWQS